MAPPRLVAPEIVSETDNETRTRFRSAADGFATMPTPLVITHSPTTHCVRISEKAVPLLCESGFYPLPHLMARILIAMRDRQSLVASCETNTSVRSA